VLVSLVEGAPKDVGEDLLAVVAVWQVGEVTIKEGEEVGRDLLQSKLPKEPYKLLCVGVVLVGGQKPHSGTHLSTTSIRRGYSLYVDLSPLNVHLILVFLST